MQISKTFANVRLFLFFSKKLILIKFGQNIYKNNQWKGLEGLLYFFSYFLYDAVFSESETHLTPCSSAADQRDSPIRLYRVQRGPHAVREGGHHGNCSRSAHTPLRLWKNCSSSLPSARDVAPQSLPHSLLRLLLQNIFTFLMMFHTTTFIFQVS